MPSKTILFEGQKHVFPDDATDDEIRQALEGMSAAPDANAPVKGPLPAKVTGMFEGYGTAPTYPGGPSTRSSGEIATDQAAEILRGIPQAITGIPGAISGLIGAVGSPAKQIELAKGLVQPAAPLAKTMIGRPPNPDSPEWSEAAQGTGALLGSIVLPEAIARGTDAAAARLGRVERIRNLPEHLMSGAASARASVAKLDPSIPRSKTDLMVQAMKTVARPVMRGGARVTEGVARALATETPRPIVGAPVLGAQPEIQSANLPPPEPSPFLGNMREPSGPPAEIPLPEGFQMGETAPKPIMDPVQRIKQAIGPTGAERQALTIRLAPELAKDPVLSQLPPGPQFDSAVFDRFQAARAELKAAGDSMPAGTTVLKAPLMDELIELIDSQSSFASNPDLVANSAATKILADWYNKLEKLPEKIPFDELRDFRQKLDKEVMTHGGWKETASSADRAEMTANRGIVNAIRRRLKGVDPRLDAADAAFGPASDAVMAAGLDWETGERLAKVGKPEPVVKTQDRIRQERVKRLRGGPL